ncbi:MAG: aldo/keto reductase, partial [Acidobacteriota bacterium]|nr:aldo/keto reductase [Acidobacteriota bacterium]
MGLDEPRRVERYELAPGYTVPRIVAGGWQLSRSHRGTTLDVEAAVGELRKLVDAGIDTFDCGDIYTGVERLLGRLRQVSPRIRIHTKLVPDRDDLAALDKRIVERIVDRSLRRLGVERLDMVQLHWWDYGVPGYVETAVWLDELRRGGKIHLLGVTNFDVVHLGEIIEAGVPIVSNQVQYSLLDHRPERGTVGFCREHG